MRQPHKFGTAALISLLLAGLACGPAARPAADPTPQIVEVVITATPLPASPTPAEAADLPTPTPSPTEPVVIPTLAVQPAQPAGPVQPLPTATEPVSSIPTATPLPPTLTPFTDVPEPTTVNIDVPTSTARAASPTQASIPSGTNRLANPGFEGNVRPVTFGEVNVFESWQPFFCDGCDNPRPCATGQTRGCNPPEVKMRRPEYKPTNLDNRVNGGQTAQQWFCYYGTCQAGVYQTFSTTAGQRCTVGAYIQSWSNFDDDPESDGLDNQDGRDNSQWVIKVDAQGGTNAFSSGLSQSGVYGFDAGHYDKYILISYQFTARGSSATVFFENLRLWPIANNDSYIDDAFAICN